MLWLEEKVTNVKPRHWVFSAFTADGKAVSGGQSSFAGGGSDEVRTVPGSSDTTGTTSMGSVGTSRGGGMGGASSGGGGSASGSGGFACTPTHSVRAPYLCWISIVYVGYAGYTYIWISNMCFIELLYCFLI